MNTKLRLLRKDGLEGLDMIVSHPYEYSAIILDINMPKLNGLELFEKDCRRIT